MNWGAQVDKAFAYLQKSGEVDKPDVRYEVTARRTDASEGQRGVLLREPRDVARPVNVSVDVKPELREVWTWDQILHVTMCVCSSFFFPNTLTFETLGDVACPGTVSVDVKLELREVWTCVQILRVPFVFAVVFHQLLLGSWMTLHALSLCQWRSRRSCGRWGPGIEPYMSQCALQ